MACSRPAADDALTKAQKIDDTNESLLLHGPLQALQQEACPGGGADSYGSQPMEQQHFLSQSDPESSPSLHIKPDHPPTNPKLRFRELRPEEHRPMTASEFIYSIHFTLGMCEAYSH